MNPNRKALLILCILALLLIHVGCSSLSKIGGMPTVMPSPPPGSPSACLGWDCTLQGVVYAGEAVPGNEVEGVKVSLSHHSNCSPTEGEHEAVTDSDGVFTFDVYVHDTDFFKFGIEEYGYAPWELSFGGFDCLYCSCNNMEIVLERQEDGAK